MSLRDLLQSVDVALKLTAVCALAGMVAVGSGCTVRPLYSSTTSSIAPAGADATSGLGSIAINPVRTRYAQEVRNHLIFLLNGGAGEPANVAYTMDLQVLIAHSSAASIQIDDEDRPTAGSLRMTASYTLRDANGEVAATGTREIASSYDQPSQEFASLRARRDAENRAAREVAELLRLDIGQRLETYVPTAGTVVSK